MEALRTAQLIRNMELIHKTRVSEMRVFELEDFKKLYNASHEVSAVKLSEEKKEFLLTSEEVKNKITEELLKSLTGRN